MTHDAEPGVTCLRLAALGYSGQALHNADNWVYGGDFPVDEWGHNRLNKPSSYTIVLIHALELSRKDSQLMAASAWETTCHMITSIALQYLRMCIINMNCVNPGQMLTGRLQTEFGHCFVCLAMNFSLARFSGLCFVVNVYWLHVRLECQGIWWVKQERA
jgi:hypothetical protein